MKKFLVIFLSLVLLTGFLLMTGCGKKPTPASDPSTDPPEQDSPAEVRAKNIIVYSGAGLRKPVEELGKMFKDKTGVEAQFTYGNCAQLMNQILTVNKGDVLLPGDAEDVKALREHDKVDAEKPLVYHVPVLAVPQGNPAGIKSLDDLKKPGTKIVLGDLETNPLGKLAKKILTKKGIYDQVEPNVVTRAATVNEMFVYLEMKQVDAAIIWEDNLVGNEKIEIVETSDFDEHIKEVPVTTLKCSENPELATQFMDFVSSSEGIKIWEKWGFRPIVGGE